MSNQHLTQVTKKKVFAYSFWPTLVYMKVYLTTLSRGERVNLRRSKKWLVHDECWHLSRCSRGIHRRTVDDGAQSIV